MKVLSLTLDLKELALPEADSKQTTQEIINNVIQNVILGYGQQQRGLDEKERRQYYKIADILEAAIKSKVESVELEDDQMGFLKKCFRDTKLMPNKLLRALEGQILKNE